MGDGREETSIRRYNVDQQVLLSTQLKIPTDLAFALADQNLLRLLTNGGVPPIQIALQVQSGQRPTMPPQLKGSLLSTLIAECWDTNPGKNSIDDQHL